MLGRRFKQRKTACLGWGWQKERDLVSVDVQDELLTRGPMELVACVGEIVAHGLPAPDHGRRGLHEMVQNDETTELSSWDKKFNSESDTMRLVYSSANRLCFPN